MSYDIHSSMPGKLAQLTSRTIGSVCEFPIVIYIHPCIGVCAWMYMYDSFVKNARWVLVATECAVDLLMLQRGWYKGDEVPPAVYYGVISSH